MSLLLLPFRLWTSLIVALSRRWRGEVLIVETRPVLCTGFALGAWLLLLIPGLNLLFRPALVVAAAHVLGHIEPPLPELDDADQPPAAADHGEADYGADGPSSADDSSRGSPISTRTV